MNSHTKTEVYYKEKNKKEENKEKENVNKSIDYYEKRKIVYQKLCEKIIEDNNNELLLKEMKESEFPYIDCVTHKEREKLKELLEKRTLVCGDPGKKSLLTLIGSNGK